MSIIMKKSLLCSFFISCAILVSAQCNDPYKSFDKFSNDTTAFLRHNFSKRAACYKGKTVAQVLTDLQLKPKSFAVLYSVWTGKYDGIYIYVDNSSENDRIQNPKRKSQYICLYWDKLLDNESVTTLIQNYDNDIWVQQHYDFFKNMVVDKVAYYK